MAKAAENRPVITLACTECKDRSYSTTKNTKTTPKGSSFAITLPHGVASTQLHREAK
jgi:large subunit ribosomal protein L33